MVDLHSKLYGSPSFWPAQRVNKSYEHLVINRLHNFDL